MIDFKMTRESIFDLRIFREMKKLLLLLLIVTACSPKTGFNAFFEEEVETADQAIDLPKWLPMLAIPNDAKEDIKLFTKGMKRVKLLRYHSKREMGLKHFNVFRDEMNMENYLNVKNNDVNLDLISKETEGHFKEIVISCDTQDAYYIFGLTGKMNKKDFQKAIAEANRNNE